MERIHNFLSGPWAGISKRNACQIVNMRNDFQFMTRHCLELSNVAGYSMTMTDSRTTKGRST
jgi:hypothetical protein